MGVAPHGRPGSDKRLPSPPARRWGLAGYQWAIVVVAAGGLVLLASDATTGDVDLAHHATKLGDPPPPRPSAPPPSQPAARPGAPAATPITSTVPSRHLASVATTTEVTTPSRRLSTESPIASPMAASSTTLGAAPAVADAAQRRGFCDATLVSPSTPLGEVETVSVTSNIMDAPVVIAVADKAAAQRYSAMTNDKGFASVIVGGPGRTGPVLSADVSIGDGQAMCVATRTLAGPTPWPRWGSTPPSWPNATRPTYPQRRS